MSEEEKSIYCRKSGIFSHHLDEWKKEFLNKKDLPTETILENRALKSENKQLKKELRRKNKALAETATILVLKKKVQEILGDEDL